MTDEVRKPKFEFVAKPRVYGMLDLSYELIVCLVENGRLRPIDYPKSWQEGVNKVGTPAARAYAQKLHDERFPEYREWVKRDAEYWTAHDAWRKDKTLPKPVRPQQTTYLTAVPPKLALMGAPPNAHASPHSGPIISD